MRAALRFTWRLTKWAGVAALLSYAAVCTGIYAMQRTLVFPKLANHVTAAHAGFPRRRKIALQTSDGERLVAWNVLPKPDKPLFIYFHGNGDTLNWRASRDRSLVADGSGLLAVSYRAYEGSTGSPSEDGHAPRRRGCLRVRNRSSDRAGPYRAVGHSLGTGVAVRLAAERKIKALVLEAPYTSVADIAAMNYPLLPVRWLLKDQFRSDLLIGKVTAPVLVFHGDKDDTIPISFGRRLYSLIKAPKCFVHFPLGGHGDLDDGAILASIHDFIARPWHRSAEPAGADGCERGSVASLTGRNPTSTKSVSTLRRAANRRHPALASIPCRFRIARSGSDG